LGCVAGWSACHCQRGLRVRSTRNRQEAEVARTTERSARTRALRRARTGAATLQVHTLTLGQKFRREIGRPSPGKRNAAIYGAFAKRRNFLLTTASKRKGGTATLLA